MVPPPGIFAGRTDEVERLLGVLTSAAAGQFTMIMARGEPGVGKTALAGVVAGLVADDMNVVFSACLPLTSLSVPFLPLSSAVRKWSAASGTTTPDLQSLHGSAAEVVVAFDAWLDRRCSERATLLMVDDLHWADQSTLDVLTYVLAGPADRRLAVLLTVRNSELHSGHRLHRWLADAARMPRFIAIGLEPLDRLGTAEQIAGLLGGPARESLVEDVFAHARGNAYLTKLLVEHLPPDAASLPNTLPATLGEAVLGSWHAMSTPARELTQLLAAGGPHLRSEQIEDMAATVFGSSTVVHLLGEALDAGLLEFHDDGSYWFRHPLQAELLEAATLPQQRRAWHAAFAELLERSLDERPPNSFRMDDVASLVAVADHYAQTNHVDRAYHSALRAADAVGSAGGATEQLRLLHRALDLLPRASSPDETRVSLLGRIRDAAERAGKQEEELAAVDLLLSETDPTISPLDAAALLVRRMDLRQSTGREFAGLREVREAVRLSATAPHSWQHALALAELAHAELWHEEPAGAAHAEAAVAAARASGNPKALSYALTAQSMAMTVSGVAGGEIPAEEAVAAAVGARDYWAFCHGTAWAANALEAWSSHQYVDYVRMRREQLISLGASHTYVGWLCAGNAAGSLSLGEWRQCVADLRVALGASPGPMGEVVARLTAALLAALQGRPLEAQAHLRRAEEMFAETSGYLAFEFDAVRAEVALAAGEPERALVAALRGARGDGLPPTRCERLIPLASRALADMAVRCREERRSDSEPLRELDALKREFPGVIVDIGAPTPVNRRQSMAMQALYDAEVLRAGGDPDSGKAWGLAADACARGDLPWEEAYALWRAAEAVVPDRGRRTEGGDLLRRAHRLAAELESVPLLHHLDGLARSARITIDPPTRSVSTPYDVVGAATTDTSEQSGSGHTIAGLTPREREVLALVTTGRTYAEIARALYISEKTVSVHISNLLRKTGTANRIELARLAQRSAAT